jgi:hypothetical protein
MPLRSHAFTRSPHALHTPRASCPLPPRAPPPCSRLILVLCPRPPPRSFPNVVGCPYCCKSLDARRAPHPASSAPRDEHCPGHRSSHTPRTAPYTTLLPPRPAFALLPPSPPPSASPFSAACFQPLSLPCTPSLARNATRAPTFPPPKKTSRASPQPVATCAVPPPPPPPWNRASSSSTRTSRGKPSSAAQRPTLFAPSP